MTFKDVQKAVQAEAELIDTKANVDLISELQGLPFWIFDQDQHRLEYRRTKAECCFWHCIKSPQKDNHDMPVLPYQRTLYEALQNHKRIAILKSRGIGCSEFLLRYIAWNCINKYPANSRVLNPNWPTYTDEPRPYFSLQINPQIFTRDRKDRSHSQERKGRGIPLVPLFRS